MSMRASLPLRHPSSCRPSAPAPAACGSGERGVVLILAIFAVVLLTVLATAIAMAVRLELRASRAGLERIQGLFLAEAGIREARALLLYDDDPALDTLQDSWGPEYSPPLDAPQPWGDGFFRVRVEDACGRIDVNSADAETLARLTGDPQVAASIIGWRASLLSPDDMYYQSLAYPYHARSGAFQTLGELMLVRGVTPDMFFGVNNRPGLADLLSVESLSSNLDPDGNEKIGLNGAWDEEGFRRSILSKLAAALSEYDVDQIASGYLALLNTGQQYTSLGQLATVAGLSYDTIAKIIDYFSVAPGPLARGQVNLNTARLEVLAALPGGSSSLATAIIARRRQRPFTSLGEFTAFVVDQPDGPDVFPLIIDHVTTRSSSFVIEAMGYPMEGRGFCTLRAVVRRVRDNVVVVQQGEEDYPLPSLAPQTQLAGGAGFRLASTVTGR